MLTLVDGCQLRISKVSVSASDWQSTRKCCPDERGGSGPRLGFPLVISFFQLCPTMLTLVDGNQLRVSMFSVKVKDWTPTTGQSSRNLCTD